MSLVVLLNGSGGTSRREGTETGEIGELLAAAGIAGRVEEVDPPQLGARARQEAEEGAEVVVAAGGDGTVGTLAGALLGTGAALGILPLGTFNHLARDLDVPIDLERAVACLARDRRRRIDVAEVGDRVFVNNSALGFYADVVAARREPRRSNRLTRMVATLTAAARVWPGFRPATLHLEVDGQRLQRTTPAVFVSNNESAMGFRTFGDRERLDEGVLQVSVWRGRGRGSLLRGVLLSLVRDLREERLLDDWRVTSAEVHLGRPREPVFLDGELTELPGPLAYRILPRALDVVAGGNGD